MLERPSFFSVIWYSSLLARPIFLTVCGGVNDIKPFAPERAVYF